MADIKLIVFHKKMSKLLKVFFVAPTNRGHHFRNGSVPAKQQRPSQKKRNLAASLWSFCRKSQEAKGLCSALRWLNFSTHHSRIYWSSRVLWKVLPHRWKEDDGNMKSVWAATPGDTPVPKFSRGFNRTPGVADVIKIQTTHGGTSVVSEEEIERVSRDVGRKTEARNVLPTRVEEDAESKPIHKEVEEQSLYTNEESPLRSYKPLKRKEVQKLDFEIPPPQRARLSCPLPPNEYLPPEKTDYLPAHRSGTARFSDPSSETGAQTVRAEDHLGYRMAEREVVRKVPNKLPALEEYPEFVPKNSKRQKNYLKMKNKSQLYPQRQAEPRMKALLFEPAGQTLSCQFVLVPTEIFKDEVLIQVSHSGVCGYDYFLMEGRISCGGNRVIPGREISGTVYAAGKDVRHVTKGDKVAVNPFTACSVCRFCSRGLCSACINEGLNNSIGSSKNGGWAEFVVVKKSQVHKVPQELGLDQAILILPLSCVLSAMSKLRLFNGMTILIQGLGLSGCLWASLLHSRGYRNVMVTDKSQRKRYQFESLLLNYPFVPLEDLRKHSADVVIECTGSPISIEKSLNILNPKGQMCFFGKPSPVTEVRCIPYDIIQREITIFGTTGNAFSFTEAIDVAAGLRSRYLDLEKLGVHTFELEQYREAFQLKKTGEVNKVIFKLDS